MAQPDILLKQDRISVVGREAGNGQVDFEVAASESTDPSVTVNADRANLTLGRGEPNDRQPPGAIDVQDEQGHSKVEIVADSDDSVYKTSSDYDQLPDPYPEPKVQINGDEPEIRLIDPVQGDTSTADLSPGSLHIEQGGQDSPTTTITGTRIEIGTAEYYGGTHTSIENGGMELGGGDRSGTLKLRNPAGLAGVQLQDKGKLVLGSEEFSDGEIYMVSDGDSSNNFFIELTDSGLEMTMQDPQQDNNELEMLRLDASEEAVYVRTGDGMEKVESGDV